MREAHYRIEICLLTQFTIEKAQAHTKLFSPGINLRKILKNYTTWDFDFIAGQNFRVMRNKVI